MTETETHTPHTQQALESVKSSGYCTGCGICIGINKEAHGQMVLTDAGFLRPAFNRGLTAENLASIQTICPGISLSHKQRDATFHDLWGPILACQVGYALDDEIRHTGSSGGVISALALYLLDSGQVDFIAQIAVDPVDPLKNSVQTSRHRGDILRAAGSRYAPAAPLERLGEFLASGQRFAVVGKPCDVAAVRNLSRVDGRITAQIPYLLSFMCAGVPSMTGTHEMLSALGVSAGNIASLRYRGDGWPGKARAVTKDGHVAEMDYATSWGTILNRHLQFRCKICPDGTGEFADITCADAWHGKDGYPDFSEQEGQSLILARTPAGMRLIDEAEKAGAISRKDLPLAQVEQIQPYQKTRKQLVSGRLLGTLLRRGWIPRFRGLGLLGASTGADPAEWLRSAVGTYRRALGE